MSNKVKLKSIDKTDIRPLRIVFNVKSISSKTTLEQDLILTKFADGWAAGMNMEGFDGESTPTKAALKLADWMERMAIAIKNYEYDVIELKDL